MIEHAVVIVGGGPTGLMLAGELALAQIDVAIVERRERQDLAGLRAGGLHIRTIEMLDQRGIAERFISQGRVIRRAPFARMTLDISDLPSRHSYFLALWQTHIERILADWVGELKVPIYRGREVTGFEQDDNSVDLELSEGQPLRRTISSGGSGSPDHLAAGFIRVVRGTGWSMVNWFALAFRPASKSQPSAYDDQSNAHRRRDLFVRMSLDTQRHIPSFDSVLFPMWNGDE